MRSQDNILMTLTTELEIKGDEVGGQIVDEGSDSGYPVM
jgi:hypothetical protein